MVFPDPKPGDVLTAEMLNVLYDAIKNGISLVPPLAKNGDGSIYLAADPGFWIEFTGAPTGVKHPWKQVLPQAGGTWEDGARSGTATDDPAYELNGNSGSLSGKRAKAWRDISSNEIRFHYSTCT